MFEDINTLKVSLFPPQDRDKQTKTDRESCSSLTFHQRRQWAVIKQPWLTFVKSIWKWYLISFVSCLPPTALHLWPSCGGWGGDLWKLHKINKPTVNCGLGPGRVRIHFIGCGRKGRGRGLWVVGWQDPSPGEVVMTLLPLYKLLL